MIDLQNDISIKTAT